MTGVLVDRITGKSIYRMIGLPDYRFTGWPVDRFTDQMDTPLFWIYRPTGYTG